MRILLPLLCLLATNALAVQFQAFTNSNTLFVDTNGNNALAIKGVPERPWRDPRSAVINASAGDTVVVFPGLYQTNNLLKSGVNVFGYPGANITYRQTTDTDPGWGIFDDRPAGASGTYNVQWLGNITMLGYTNSDANDGTAGAVVVTNANTFINFRANKVSFSTIGTGYPTPAAILLLCCASNSTFYMEEILDPYYGALGTTTSGIIWDIPQYPHVHAAHIGLMGGNYAMWGIERSGTHTNDFFFEGDVLESKIYVDIHSAQYRGWYDFKYISDTASGPTCMQFAGSGRHYVTGLQKANSNFGYCLAVNNGDGGTSNVNVWVTSEKFTGHLGWASIDRGTTHLRVQQYEDDGSIGTGFLITGGTNYFHGGIATVLNGKGVDYSGAGYSFFDNVTLDTSLTAGANKHPVTISANGLSLKGCSLVAPAASQSITNTAAITNNVGVYWSAATTTNSLKVNISPNAVFTIDTGVK